VLIHTGVPEALGGRGVGGKLVQAALERARHEGMVVRPECEFARGWIDKHPDALTGVTIDVSGL
jgi:predicted GNAT family acetyltransferase